MSVKVNKYFLNIFELNPLAKALKFLRPETNPPVPWHRIINSSGSISSRGPGNDGARRQRDALVAEGVEVTETQDGEFKVDLREYGWFPSVPIVAERQEAIGQG